MNFARTASLSILIAGTCVAWTASQAHAQSQWTSGAPVFQSDVEQRPRQFEAQRAERSKSYSSVAYPKFMEGGGKPDIAPEKPPVAYLEKNEPPGTIIVDTGGRKLYYVLPGNRAYAYPISVGRERVHLDGNRAHQPHRFVAIVDAAA